MNDNKDNVISLEDAHSLDEAVLLADLLPSDANDSTEESFDIDLALA